MGASARRFAIFAFTTSRESPSHDELGMGQRGDEFFPRPLFLLREGRIAERVGEPPTDLDQVVKADFSRSRIVMVRER